MIKLNSLNLNLNQSRKVKLFFLQWEHWHAVIRLRGNVRKLFVHNLYTCLIWFLYKCTCMFMYHNIIFLCFMTTILCIRLLFGKFQPPPTLHVIYQVDNTIYFRLDIKAQFLCLQKGELGPYSSRAKSNDWCI